MEAPRMEAPQMEAPQMEAPHFGGLSCRPRMAA